MLRERAANEPGGVVVSVLAYNSEYAKAEATKKYAEAAANRKGCELPKKTAVGAQPRPGASTAAHPEGSTTPHPRPQAGLSGISQ